jgi:ACS family glucarate transporter-like MFS transporter
MNYAATRSQIRAIPVRMRILGLLFLLSFVNYFLRNNLSVALPSIRDEFHFTSTELGWILGSFNFAYALFQVPTGVYGDVVGPRRALALAAISWGVLTALTGFAPALFAASATGALVSLMVVRFLMGIANAPMFPVAAGAFEKWFPVGNWAFPNAILSAGLTLGQAALGPIVTMLIIHYGWRESFYVLAPVGIIAGLWWWWYARDVPGEHRAITREEIELIESGRTAAEGPPRSWSKVLVQRDVLLLAASYFCDNYVFYIFSQWLFTYLVEERHFTLLESGWLYSLPFVVGAVLAVAGGVCCDVFSRHWGPRLGCRVPAIVGLVMVAVLLLTGAEAANPFIAVGLLSLCFGFTQFIEGAFWQAATFAGGPHTATATGVLNMGGNLAGFLAPVVGLLLDHFGWFPTLASGSVFALVGALLWLFIRVDQK